jgi:hypothetical protein
MKNTKNNMLNTPRTTFLATWAAGWAAAGLMLCGHLTQAQPGFSSISLPNAIYQGSVGEAVGAVQFQGSIPSGPSATGPNQLTFTVSSQTGVTAVSVTLTGTNLPGVVTTTILTTNNGLTISGSPTSETVTVPLANDIGYHAVLSATDANSTTADTIAHFDTINPNYFTFEAEDFDYSGGLFVDSLPPGTFQNLDIYGTAYGILNNDIAEPEIDAQHGYNSGQSDTYRTTAASVAADLLNATCSTGAAGDIPRYQYVTSGLPDAEVGYNSNSDWANYTRTYPAGVYNIYLRGAAGSDNSSSPLVLNPNTPLTYDFNESEVGLVTSGWGTTNQTTNFIGSFSPLYVGGYSDYMWAPALNTNGALAAWVAAGDVETLRMTVARAQANYNCYMLVPAVPNITPNNTNVFQGSAVSLSFYPVGLGNPTMQWQSDNGSGGTTWSNIPGATTTNLTLNTSALSSKVYQYRVALNTTSNNTVDQGAGLGTAETIDSTPLFLNVLPPSKPVVVTPLISATEDLNANTNGVPFPVTYTASFTGSPPITYQWYVATVTGSGVTNAFTAIPGSNGLTLTVNPSNALETNVYEVQASNSIGVTFSAPASLTLNPAPFGPFPDTNWPASINAAAPVDYIIINPNNTFITPPNWTASLTVQGGGDQSTAATLLNGFTGDQTTSTYLNFADTGILKFESYPVVDILMQVYGDANLYTPTGSGTNEVLVGDPIAWLEGTTLGNSGFVYGTTLPSIPYGSTNNSEDNSEWNWVLFEVTNSINPADGYRVLGDPTSGVPGGVNGGSIRMQNFGTGLTVAAIAWGPQGSFGATNQINLFVAAPPCNPEPVNVNLASVDFNKGVTNNLIVVQDPVYNFTYIESNGVGPSNDLRTAIQSSSGLMNFAVLSNYLGQPCNPPRTMQVCIEFYDDPALAGTRIGIYQHATDSGGDLVTTAALNGTTRGYSMTGTGKWLKAAFYLGGVNLSGVDVAPLTGGPDIEFLTSANATAPVSPWIDRVELGIMRISGPLSGLTPDPNYYIQPLICSTNYGYYAELDPHLGITNGVAFGPGGGDQTVAYELAGPTNDQRLSEVTIPPSGGIGDVNMQFVLANTPFGPTFQDNMHIAMRLTYYDDPNYVGAQLFPQVYMSVVAGVETLVFPAGQTASESFGLYPGGISNATVTLQGTGQWLDAYFELPNVCVAGVNASPSVVRYEVDWASTNYTTPGNPLYNPFSNPANTNKGIPEIAVSRVRYNVIRPCGPYQGINMLQEIGATKGGTNVSVNWFGTGTLKAATSLTGPFTNVMSIPPNGTNTFISPFNLTNAYTPAPEAQAQFFQLAYPPYPTNIAGISNVIIQTLP